MLGFDVLMGTSRKPKNLTIVEDGSQNGGLYRVQRYVFGDNYRMFGGVFDPTRNWYSLVPPGIINLSGERYATLRCKEIEEHMIPFQGSSMMIKGIGTFKMASANEITFVRFDFMSLQRKPFHPIGKLHRLSFRFEKNDGELYDFKSVNHQLLINVKHLVTKNDHKFGPSVLNPAYDPDLVAYANNLPQSSHPPRRLHAHNGGGRAGGDDHLESTLNREIERCKVDAEYLKAYDYSSEESYDYNEDDNALVKGHSPPPPPSSSSLSESVDDSSIVSANNAAYNEFDRFKQRDEKDREVLPSSSSSCSSSS